MKQITKVSDEDKVVMLLKCNEWKLSTIYIKENRTTGMQLPGETKYVYMGDKHSLYFNLIRFGTGFVNPDNGVVEDKFNHYNMLKWLHNLKYTRQRIFTFYQLDGIAIKCHDSFTNTSVWLGDQEHESI